MSGLHVNVLAGVLEALPSTCVAEMYKKPSQNTRLELYALSFLASIISDFD